MGKVDEQASVPDLDAAALERLGVALDRSGVVAAALFGSWATGRAGPLSDVDVSVWVEPDLTPEQLLSLRLELADAAASALGTGEVDLVVLNDAPPALRHRAVRDGVLLVDRAPIERVRFETAAVIEYLDTAPLRAIQDEGRRQRLAEGTFGRR